MDGNLDDLIRFLLEQIALRGEIGALPADILRFLDLYHADNHRQQPRGPPSTGVPNFDTFEPKLDRRYREQVWKWLTRHPEIHVGRSREGNRMSLAEVEAHNEKAREARKPDHELQTTTTAGNSVEPRLPGSLVSNIDGTILNNNDNIALALAQLEADQLRSVRPRSPTSSILHVFTSTERMWYAAAGHEPDFERIPSKEFVCLSVIASHGARGILQPDLVRITGQDKRSVPMRTQNLHDKGYIVKKPVITAGMRTSLCILKRFTLQLVPGPDKEILESHAVRRSGEVEINDFRDSIFGHVELEIRQTFELLREPKLVTWTDLKRKVGVYMQHSPSRWLARAMRKLEDLGYVQRVRAPGNIRISQRSLHKCIKLLREPREEEWQAFFQMSSDSAEIQQLKNQDAEDNEEGLEEDYRVDNSVQVDFDGTGICEREPAKQAHHCLLWTPDRPLTNILHDAVQASGTTGVKSVDLKDDVVGFFFNRSLDHQIGRLVELWQASQPLHLRHLAILRDTTIAGKTTHYLYYTYEIFKSMVDAGCASWEAVETIRSDGNKGEDSTLSIDAIPELDEYGFPRLDPSRFHGHNNVASLAECSAASGIKPFRLTKLDQLVTRAQGTRSGGSAKAVRLGKDSTKMPRIERRGRPPKHFQNNINAPKTNTKSKNVKENEIAKRRSREYQRKKAETEVAEWVDKGKEVLCARVYVLKKYVPVLEARGVAAATATALQALGSYECASEPENLFDLPLATTGSSTDQSMDVMAIWADVFAITESKPGCPFEKRKGRPTKTVSQLGYFPSILAHTLPLPLPQVAKRKGGYRSKKITTLLGYMPSIAAHTLPLVELQAKPPWTNRRSPRTINEPQHPAITDSQNAAHMSYVEHLQNQAPQSQVLLGTSHRKRTADSHANPLLQPLAKRRGRMPRGISSQLPSPPSPIIDLAQPPSPFVPTQAQEQIRPVTGDTQQRPNLGQALGSKLPARARKKTAKALDGETLNQAIDLIPVQEAQSRPRPYLTYAEQVRVINRPQTGIFLGPLVDLNTSLHRGRPRKSRLAVFKSPDLKTLAWFKDNSLPSATETTAPDVGNTLHEADVYTESTARDATELFTDGSRARAPESQAKINGKGTSNVASFSAVDGSGTSRKRKRFSNGGPLRQSLAREIFTPPPAPDPTSLSQQAVHGNSRTDDHILNKVRTDTSHAQMVNDTTSRYSLELCLQEAVVDVEDSRAVSTVTDLSLVPTPRESPQPDQGFEPAMQIDERVDQPNLVNSFNDIVEPLGHNPSVDHEGQQQTLRSDRHGYLNIRRPSDEPDKVVTPTPSQRSTTTETRRLSNDDSLHASDDDLPEVPRYLNEGSQEVQFQSPKITKVRASGGSVAVMRRNIILEIVEKYGGVFPGDNQIHRPFCKLWMLRTGSARPESRTIQTALKSLVDGTRLRKLRFTFHNKVGVAVTKSLITLNSIAPTDPRVRDLQRKIAECDPQPYYPDEENSTSSLDQTNVQPERPIDPANTARGHRDRLRIIEDTVQLQTFPKNVVKRSREQQGQEKEERLRRQLEEELGEPQFVVDGYQPSRFTLASEAAGTHEFPLWPGAGSADDMHRRVESREPTPKRRRLATLLSTVSERHNSGGSVTRITQPKGRLMKLVRKVAPALNLSLDDVYLGTRSARVLGGHDREHAVIRIHNPPQIQFTEAMGINSNFDRTPSPDPEDIQWDEDQSMLIGPTIKRIDPPGHGARIDLQYNETCRKIRRSRRRPIDMQLRSILRKYQESTPLSRLYRKSARLRAKHAPDDASGSVFNADSARWQMLSLMDPEHTFHLPSGTFAAGFASQYIPPERQLMPTKKQRKIAPESARRQISYLMNPKHVFHEPSGTFSVQYAVLGKIPSVEAEIQPTEFLLPDDLEDLLSRPCNGKMAQRQGTVGALEDSIPEQVDHVKMWEMATPELASTKSNEWRFINLQWSGPFEDAPDDDWSPVFEDDQQAREQERRSLREKEKMQKQSSREMVLKAPPPNNTPAKRKLVAPEFTTRQLMASKADVALKSKLLQRDRRADADGRPLKRVRLRGPQQAMILGPDGDRRIMFAVIIVRTLTGGVEQNIDWVLLTHIFDFEVPERFIHQRWAQLLQKHRLVVDKLQSDFQDMFIQAYDAGSAPPLDYEKLEDYDWNGLIDWASQSIHAPTSSNIPELPETREKLDDLYEFREVDEKDIAEFFEIENNAAVPKRETVIHRYPQVVPLHAFAPHPDATSKLSIARSWVRANVITPEDTYNSESARRKLISLGDVVIENAVRDLLLLKVIMQENKGRLVPGRNYDISEHFLFRFRKKLDIERFRQAVAYKNYLDRMFAAECVVDYSWDASDGEVIVVLNLAAHGRIRMVPKNPPSNKFGLNEKGTYKSRSIAKEMFRFTVELEPAASYVQGNPLSPLPPPPGPVSDSAHGVLNHHLGPHMMDGDSAPDLARLPAWIDINNDPVPLMWELSLAAILSIMAARPGVSAKDIEKCLRPSLEVWEIERVMKWCVQAGVGTWTGGLSGEEERGAVRLDEWWWMALGERS